MWMWEISEHSYTEAPIISPQLEYRSKLVERMNVEGAR